MPCFAIILYTSERLQKHATAVLEAYERFEAMCSRELLRLYCTSTMPQRKAVTSQAFGRLKKGLGQSDELSLDLTGGGMWAATSDINFSVLGRKQDARPNWIRITVPLACMDTDLAALEAEARRLFGSLPFVSGCAGPSLEISPYYRPASHQFAWKTVMKYPGVDFCDPYADASAVGTDGLRTVNWLTFLGASIVKQLGGAKKIGAKLTRTCELSELPTGVCIKAGAAPELGDRVPKKTLADYTAVFHACEPAIARMMKRQSPFILVDDENRERDTNRMLRRLAFEK
jgi:hypothetical protein